jgi:hypothetical protein
MAKKKKSGGDNISPPEGRKPMAHPAPETETTSGFWKRILRANPQLLRQRSNEQLYEIYKKEHGVDLVPTNAKQGLSNIKSQLRKEKKLGKRKAAVAAAAGAGEAAARPVRLSVKGLEALEEHIDDALGMAKTLDRTALEPVIQALRKARYEVILKMKL